MAIETSPAREARKRYRASNKYKNALRRYMAKPEVKAKAAMASAKWYATSHGRAKALCLAAMQRAKNKNMTFDLDEEWIRTRIEKGFCSLTGIPFELVAVNKRERAHPWAPSVDRIDSSKGYTKDNCRVVVWMINWALGEFGEARFNQLATAYINWSWLR